MNELIRGYRRIKKALRSITLEAPSPSFAKVLIRPVRCVKGSNTFNETEILSRKEFDGVCIIMTGRAESFLGSERIYLTFAVPNYVLRDVGRRYKDEDFTLLFDVKGLHQNYGLLCEVSMKDIGEDLLEGL